MCLWRLPSLHPFSNECFCMTFSQLDQSVNVMNYGLTILGLLLYYKEIFFIISLMFGVLLSLQYVIKMMAYD